MLHKALHNKKLGLFYELSLGVKKKEKIVFFLIPARIRAIKNGNRWRCGGWLCELPSALGLLHVFFYFSFMEDVKV